MVREPDQSSDEATPQASVEEDAAVDAAPVDAPPAEADAAVDAQAAPAEQAPASDNAEDTPEPDGPESEEPASEEAASEEAASESEEPEADEAAEMQWYILKVQVNREDSIRDALLRRVKIEDLEEYVADVVVPTEEVAEFTKSGKRRIVRRKLYPGYILAHMTINDDTWFVVRETPGVGDFTGSAGRPTPMDPHEVERILRMGASEDEAGTQIKTAIPFKAGDRVRVKDGNFQNFEGEVDAIDEANGRITVMINIFNRSTPVELEHWQVEAI
jgi:transcriptional antiterminator NusG